VSESNPIRVFATHNFGETDDYFRIFEFLESADRFYYVNVSKPENMPTMGGLQEIRDELIRQIKSAETVIVIPSAWEANKEQVNFMLDVADANQLPMIVIKPFGGMQETPSELVTRCAEHIEWNEREMVDALKRQARGEETARWEAIDFPGWDESGPIED
jgi:hypothetical protein